MYDDKSRRGSVNHRLVQVLELGHVNLFVTDLDRSTRFYRGVLCLPEVARAVINGRRVAFFSLGTRHHDLALVEVGDARRTPQAPQPGLNHVGLKIGDSLNDLRAVRDHLRESRIEPSAYRDHRVCKSIHIADPDGIGIELYADADPAIWGMDPAAVAFSQPLQLD